MFKGAEVQYSRVLLTKITGDGGDIDDIELHSPVGDKTSFIQLQVHIMIE